MKELSLNILDISENSTKAGATLVEISVTEKDNVLTLVIKDNGCGMDEETVRSVTNPFYTTRTTRKVGMGIPLLILAAEQTGGSVTIQSVPKEKGENHGTVVTAVFMIDHIDFTPIGDIVSTVTTLIQGHPATDFVFTHTSDAFSVQLDTRQLREVLGDVPLDSYEVIKWTKEYLREQYSPSDNNNY